MDNTGYIRQTHSERRKRYLDSLDQRFQIKQRKVPFIVPDFLPDFYLCQGLILVGAESGRAKSTTCSNIIAGFLRASDRDVIVITNEEATDAILNRTACIMMNKSYHDFFHDKLDVLETQSIIERAQKLSERVEVAEGETDGVDTLEGVKAVLTTAACDGNVGMVCVDYHQTIVASSEHPEWESYRVSKELGYFLRSYGKQYGIPVVDLVQLSPSTTGPTMGSRIMNDKTLITHAFIAIEIVPDFNTLTTEFIVAKDRFSGTTGKKVKMDYAGGRLVMPGQTREELRNGAQRTTRTSL